MSTPNDAPSMPATAERGLSRAEVEARVESGRTNKVKDSTSRSLAEIIRANVFTLFNGIILAAMVLVLITGSWRDAVFGFVIIINTGIGIVTELRAKRTLDKLSILVASDFLCSTTSCGSVPASRCRPTRRSSKAGGWSSTNRC